MTTRRTRGKSRFRRRPLLKRKSGLDAETRKKLEESSVILSSDVATLDALIADAADFHQRAEALEKDGHFDTAKELARIADQFLEKANRLAGTHERKKAAAKS